MGDTKQVDDVFHGLLLAGQALDIIFYSLPSIAFGFVLGFL